MPEARLIPADLIAKWLALPENTPLDITLTRADIDPLLLALARMVDASHYLGQALHHMSNQKIEDANTAYQHYLLNLKTGGNHASDFSTAIMARATHGQ